MCITLNYFRILLYINDIRHCKLDRFLNDMTLHVRNEIKIKYFYSLIFVEVRLDVYRSNDFKLLKKKMNTHQRTS